jgi:hypothetical protein
MKSFRMRAAAIALAVFVSFAVVAEPAPRDRDRARENGGVVRVIKKIKRVLGIVTNDDLPLPPFPDPKTKP